MDNLIQHSKIILPNNYKELNENWLKIEVFRLWKYPFTPAKFELYDKEGAKCCICRFVAQYEGKSKLSGYFCNIQKLHNSEKIFGDVQLLIN